MKNFKSNLKLVSSTKSGAVAINSKKNFFKNAAVLNSSAVQTLKDSPAIKSSFRTVDSKKDSERISAISKFPIFPTSAPKASPPIPLATFRPVDTTPQGAPRIPAGASTIPSEVPVTPIAGVVVSSSLAPSEQIIFGSGSFLFLPLNPEVAEKSSGLQLEKWEKPRIIANIAEDIRSGYPTKNVVIFKKLTSNRANVLKYIVYRKRVFKDLQFSKIAQFDSDQVFLDKKYEFQVKDLGYNPKDTFSFVDSNISNNSTYVYKIEVEWESNGKNPQPEFKFFGLIENSFASLFLSGAI